MPRTASRQSPDAPSAAEEILASARREIEQHGILGLRVAEVAAGANSALTQIYRYFGDRNGLLAAVLGEMYEEIQRTSYETFMAKFARCENPTLDDVASCIPDITDPEVQRVQAVRLQILAAAVTNEPLHRRLTEATAKVAENWAEGMQTIRRRLPEDSPFDTRVFMMLAMQMPYYRTLMGPDSFTDAHYKRFIADALGLTPRGR